MEYNGRNLDEVCQEHQLWFVTGGLKGSQADFSGKNLAYIDLSQRNLYGANFSNSSLIGVKFVSSNLDNADFKLATCLRCNFISATLRHTNFTNAKLAHSNLSFAYLYDTHVENCDFVYTHVLGTCFVETDLSLAKNKPYISMVCPVEGSFIGWKKCKIYKHIYMNGSLVEVRSEPVIIKLLILDDAKRLSGTSKKCRCDKAKVLEIQTIEGIKSDRSIAYSTFDPNFKYEVGQIITPIGPFNTNRWEECASGIHFFIDREDAVNYTV